MSWWCVASDAPWSWHWRPYLGAWLLCGLLLGLPGWRRRAPGSGGHTAAVWFVLGVVCVWSATDWPIAALGAGYLSVHTAQYLLLGLAAPALLLLGVDRAEWARLEAAPVLRRLLVRIAHPVSALFAFTAILVATHVPSLLDWLMASEWGAFALDMSWLVGGVLLWLPVFAPPPFGLSIPARVGYLAAAAVPHAAPAAFLVFSDYPLYRLFELSPRVDGIGAGTDQQIAGVVMNIGSMIVFLVAFSVAFLEMARHEA